MRVIASPPASRGLSAPRIATRGSAGARLPPGARRGGASRSTTPLQAACLRMPSPDWRSLTCGLRENPHPSSDLPHRVRSVAPGAHPTFRGRGRCGPSSLPPCRFFTCRCSAVSRFGSAIRASTRTGSTAASPRRCSPSSPSGGGGRRRATGLPSCCGPRATPASPGVTFTACYPS